MRLDRIQTFITVLFAMLVFAALTPVYAVPDGGDPVPTEGGEGEGGECEAQDFYDALAGSESGGRYDITGPTISSGMHQGTKPQGKYQFMPKTLEGMGYISPGQCTLRCEEFLANPALQEQAIRDFTADNDACLQRNGAYEHLGTNRCGCTLTKSGLLGAAHLGGCGGASSFAKGNSGCGGSDQLGTSLADYCKKFSGYNMFGSGSDGDCGAPDGEVPPFDPAETFVGRQQTIASPHEENLRWFLLNHFISSFMQMAEQFTVTMMHQMLILGSLMDAKIQMEVQMHIQEMTAEAHKSYRPSEQMCVIGTNVRGLRNASAKAERNAQLLNTMMQDRDILAQNMAPSSRNDGRRTDTRSRMKQFKEKYCVQTENNDNMDLLECSADGKQITRDVNIIRHLDSKLTLDMDLTDTTLTPDEEDAITLSRYLFSHQAWPVIPSSYFRDPENPIIGDVGTENVILDKRSVDAMSSVGRYSLSEIMGMRAKSETKASPFTTRMLMTMGVSEKEALAFLGENPSYFAQMEALTNIAYQNPDFFTNLYDTPANLKRMKTTLKAVELMQDRDRYESALRREMLISLIVENKLRQYQDTVEERLYKTLENKSVNTQGAP